MDPEDFEEEDYFQMFYEALIDTGKRCFMNADDDLI